MIASDETSARVEGQTCWQWVFGSATAVAHRIAASRGKAVVSEFLKDATPEVWVSDRLGAQMNHATAHQVCLAHLLRDSRYAIEAGDKLFAPGFNYLLKRAIAIGRRRESLADSTLLVYRRDLERRLGRLLAVEPDTEAGLKLRRGMEKCQDKLFVFVTRRDVPPTNNISERRLRPSVIFRKVTNGFRSAWGAAGYAAVCSVIETGMLRGLSAFAASALASPAAQCSLRNEPAHAGGEQLRQKPAKAFNLSAISCKNPTNARLLYSPAASLIKMPCSSSHCVVRVYRA